MIWAVVFALPSQFAEMAIPRSSAISRRAVTANSRPTIKVTIHAGACCSSTREINAALIRSLSAIGSSMAPVVVIRFVRRAIIPSRASVRAANRKMPKPQYSLSGISVSSTTTRSGTRKMRNRVNMLGMFHISISFASRRLPCLDSPRSLSENRVGFDDSSSARPLRHVVSRNCRI